MESVSGVSIRTLGVNGVIDRILVRDVFIYEKVRERVKRESEEKKFCIGVLL